MRRAVRAATGSTAKPYQFDKPAYDMAVIIAVTLDRVRDQLLIVRAKRIAVLPVPDLLRSVASGNTVFNALAARLRAAPLLSPARCRASTINTARRRALRSNGSGAGRLAATVASKFFPFPQQGMLPAGFERMQKVLGFGTALGAPSLQHQSASSRQPAVPIAPARAANRRTSSRSSGFMLASALAAPHRPVAATW